MTHVRVLVRYGGVWDDKKRKYEGGLLKGIVVSKEITHKNLVGELYALTEVDPKLFDIKMRCIYEIKSENQTPPFEIDNDRDLKFYLLGENMFEVPLYISFEPGCKGLTSDKDLHFEGNKSISGSNQVKNLATNVLGVGHATLDDNVVQVSLGDDKNEITRWESYDSREDKFASKVNETNKNSTSESYGIPKDKSTSKYGKRKRSVECQSHSQKTNMNKNIWSEGSSTNDELEVGQIFLGKSELSMKLSVVAMKKNFEFTVKKSTKEILYVRCIDDKCKWRLRAVKLKGSDIFKISKYVNVHSCSLDILNHDHRQAKSWVVGELIKSKFKETCRQYKPHDIIADMKQDYGVNMSYEKAWRARENAYMRVRGSPEESYNILHQYGEALKLANPGTFYDIELEDGRFFKYFFLALGPCVRGFLNCMRHVIVIDGTFLKSKYKGTLVIATCLDGNNQIFPLAFGIVDREADNSIKWFLEKLKAAIGEINDLVFVSDRNKSISKSIASVFPTAFHALCVQHLRENLHTKFKSETIDHLFYHASRAYREGKFQESWGQILAFDNRVGEYLEEVGLPRWARMHCPRRRYNIMTTNIAESMKAVLKEPREFPVTAFVEHLRALLQRWFWERRDEASKVTSTLTKWAEGIVQKNQEHALTMKVNSINCYQLHVNDLNQEEIVDLNTRECSCKVFQLDQLPCAHAIAAATDRNISVYSFCHRYYTNECLLAAYAEPIYPVGNASEWKTPVDYVEMNVLPPKVVARVGWRQRKRISSVGETPIFHKCGRCKKRGHNRLTCRNPIAYAEK